MLVTYARHLGPHFAPHVQSMAFVLPLLKFVFEEGVRTASANLIPFLIKAYMDNPHVRQGACLPLLASFGATRVLH